MNPAVKKLWIEALKSGEYKQGKNALRSNDNTYCCLGVLCDIYSKQFNIKWIEKDGVMELLEEEAVLPNDVVCWSDLPNDNPLLYARLSCAEVNDDLDYTFEQIADLIEKIY